LLGVYVFYKLLDVIHNQNNLSYPYLFLTLFFLLLAYLVYRYLNVKDLDVELHHGKVPPFALNHLNLIFGALAVFFYVGSEVSIGTNLVAYIKSDSALNLSTSTSGKLLAFYWGGSMIGRFLGGVALNQTIKLLNKFLLMVIIAISLTLLIIYVGGLTGLSLKYYLWFEALAIILFMLSRNVRVNVILFSIVNIASLIIGIVNHENQWLSVWVILAIGLFNSVMWSNIFDLALANLGKYKEQGSSFLVMMILGGAIIPIIQGRVADLTNIQSSFYVPLIGYCYILGYALFYTTKQIKLIK
jgi:MFS transporter, FHS family, L-fucose permease